MKRILFASLFVCNCVFCEEKQTDDVAKLSEAMGQLIGKNLHSMGVQIDIDALVRGMKEGCQGTDLALSEDECIEAIAQIQEKSLALQAEKNLKEANDFLKNNEKNKDIISLEKGKVQYQVTHAGSGDAVQPYNAPLLRYHGRYLNGESIGSSTDSEIISLDETIDGFSKGIIGMREGEKRTIYIHPELGYGPNSLSMPNALLIFEVEVIRADASADAQAASNADDLVTDPLLR